jgi:hypothetical protein
MINAVHALSTICDIPEYEGFGWGDRTKSLTGTHDATGDFVPIKVDGRPHARRLREVWRPKIVVGNVPSWNDYPTVGFTVPAFSRRAVDALRDLLEPNGELLPLISDAGEYYAYNITVFADVLDVEHSEIVWGLDYKFISSITRHEFHADRLNGLSIFSLPQMVLSYYVTNEFVERIREHRLNGFDVPKVWPLPPGADWWELSLTQNAARQKKVAELRRRRGGANDQPPLEPLE